MKARCWCDYGLPSAKDIAKRLDLPPMPTPLHAGNSVDAALDILKNALGMNVGEVLEIPTPIGVKRIEAKWLPHIVEKRNDARERYANLILPTLQNPTEIWESDYEFHGKWEKREHFIKIWRAGSNAFFVVVNLEKGGTLWNGIPLRIRSVDRQREGKLLWREDASGG